jgi:Tfp pilus assembly protein FimT
MTRGRFVVSLRGPRDLRGAAGFTLVKLLVMIAIIAILATLSMHQ